MQYIRKCYYVQPTKNDEWARIGEREMERNEERKKNKTKK